MGSSGRAVWSFVVAIAVAGSLVSLVPARGTFSSGQGCCLLNATNPGCIDGVLMYDCMTRGNFTAGALCGPLNASCVPEPTGCCSETSRCEEGITQSDCLGSTNSTFVEDGACGKTDCIPPKPTATATATATETGTATATPTDTVSFPNGGACLDPTDCMSGNCVDDVCCDTACDGEGEVCGLEGQVGTCVVPAAGAPAASGRALALIVFALIGIAVLGIGRLHTAAEH